VPTTSPAIVMSVPDLSAADAKTCARPKSVTTARGGTSGPASSSITLLLLKSRCTIPDACAADKAPAICVTIASAWSVVNRPSRCNFCDTFSPCSSSIVTNVAGSGARRCLGRRVLEQIEGATDVGMGDLARELNFAPEPLPGAFVGSDLRTNGLQRDRLAEDEILRFVQLAHAAAGDESNDAEPVAQQIPRPKQRHRGGNVRVITRRVWS
jgi:hypothetical protein